MLLLLFNAISHLFKRENASVDVRMSLTYAINGFQFLFHSSLLVHFTNLYLISNYLLN